MKTVSVFTIILLFVWHATVVAQTDSVSMFIKAKMSELRIPGAQVAVVSRGQIIFNKAFGIANIQDQVPAKAESIFAINSCTKAFTGVAIMQLVEDGKLDLDAPISKYIEGLPVAWQAIRINQLLTHISGLPDINRQLEIIATGQNGLSREMLAWEKVKTMPMDSKTGTIFSYNQTNYYLLAKVIDKLANKPFVQVFEDRQIKVSGMEHTRHGDVRDVIPNFAQTYLYRRNIDGPTRDVAMLTNFNAEFPAGLRAGSGLNSTSTDMARWIIALQQGKLLKTKAAISTMWSPALYNNGTPTEWALGWGIAKWRLKHRAFGMSGGGRSAFLVYPDDDLAVVVLTNLSGASPENFLEEIAGYYNADIPNSDPVTALRIRLNKRGYAKSIEVYQELRSKDPSFKPNEFELNEWGYRMMADQINAAVGILKLNVYLYPDSWNVYDSYGEALWKSGQKEEAAKMYRKSIELNPNNEGGKSALKKISGTS